MSLPWHRKYRPRTVDQLDQTSVRNFVETILSSGKVSNAYLFTGPKGTGKTSAARILARIVNCEKNAKRVQKKSPHPLKEPCGTCDSCKAIESGQSTSVIEIDAASNRGIDDIRTLREQVILMPTDGSPFKVYIIDEVHMLTTEAFNALLKTLEEPPAHVIFCLATTEEHKLPGTIISRCTRVGYAKSTAEEIVRSLGRITSGEKLKVPNEALNVIATKADGSFRDAVVLLEQLAGGGKITVERIQAEIGESNPELIDRLISDLLQGRTLSCLEIIDDLSQSGAKMKLLAQTILETAMAQIKTAVHENKPADVAQLTELIEVFSKCFARFADVPIESLPLEMAVVEYCLKSSSPTSSSPAPSSNTPPAKNPVASAPPTPAPKIKTASVPQPKIQPIVEPVVKPEEKVVEKIQQVEETLNQVVDTNSNLSLELEQVKQEWRNILRGVSENNHGLVTLLQKAQLVGCEGNRVHLSVGYSFHKQQLEQDRYARIIESVISGIFGDTVRITIKVDQAAKVPRELESHQNVSAQIKKQDEDLINAVEDVFGV